MVVDIDVRREVLHYACPLLAASRGPENDAYIGCGPKYRKRLNEHSCVGHTDKIGFYKLRMSEDGFNEPVDKWMTWDTGPLMTDLDSMCVEMYNSL